MIKEPASDLLHSIPVSMREQLLKAYNQIVRNFRELRWEPSELNGGKLCEIVYSVLKGYVEGSIPSAPSKPSNMVDACRALENAPTHFPRSVRVQMPRILVALYEVRNNRGVGHAGGDVDPNHMDATAVMYMSKWLMAELVRVFHRVDMDTAAKRIDEIVDKTTPIVWKVKDKYRVLNRSLSMMEKTLLILYHHQSEVAETDLASWVEHSNLSVYRRDVLRKAHKLRYIEYDSSSRTAVISPVGIVEAERLLAADLE